MLQATHDDPLKHYFTPLTLAFFVCSYVLVLTYWLADDTGKGQLFLLMLLQLSPLVLSFIQRRYSYLSFVMLAFFLTYSMGKYNQHFFIDERTFLPETVINALRALTHCCVFIVMGYFITKQFVPVPGRGNRTFHMLTLTKKQVYLICFFVISQYWMMHYIPKVFHTLYYMANGMAVIVVLCSRIPNAKWLEPIILLGATLNALVHFLYSESMGTMGSLGGTLFMVCCLRRRMRDCVPLALLVVAMCALQVVKNDYRVENRLRGNISLGKRFVLMGDLLYDKFVAESILDDDSELIVEARTTEENFNTLAEGFGRVGDDSLERVLSWTPERIPFAGGSTYKNIPFMMIPRFLWPDKPEWNQWNEFGRKYGFLSQDDYQTSVGVSFLGEAYMNFGFVGMYVCSLLFGIMIAIIERLSYMYLKEAFCFTYIAFLFPLLHITSNLGPILNSIVIMTASMFAFRPFLRRLGKVDRYEDGI